MKNKNRLFRKSRFGGFNRDDVIDYISDMRNEFSEYKNDVEKTVATMRKRISELEKENSVLRKVKEEDAVIEKAANAVYPVNDINEATDHLKMVADELCDSLTKFLDKLNESSFTVTVEACEKEEASCCDNVNVVSEILDNVLSSQKVIEAANVEAKENSFIDSVLPSYLFE